MAHRNGRTTCSYVLSKTSNEAVADSGAPETLWRQYINVTKCVCILTLSGDLKSSSSWLVFKNRADQLQLSGYKVEQPGQTKSSSTEYRRQARADVPPATRRTIRRSEVWRITCQGGLRDSKQGKIKVVTFAA